MGARVYTVSVLAAGATKPSLGTVQVFQYWFEFRAERFISTLVPLFSSCIIEACFFSVAAAVEWREEKCVKQGRYIAHVNRK